MEDYKKLYEDAHERMEFLAKCEHPEYFSEANKSGEIVFPELTGDEDENIMKELADFIYITVFPTKDIKKKERFLSWLEKHWLEKHKSVLKEHDTWKPSDEQMHMLKRMIMALPPGEVHNGLESLYNDLKKLLAWVEIPSDKKDTCNNDNKRKDYIQYLKDEPNHNRLKPRFLSGWKIKSKDGQREDTVLFSNLDGRYILKNLGEIYLNEDEWMVADDEELTEKVRPKFKVEQKSNNYCQENCKGYQETGKCFADGDCKAKRDFEQKLINDTDEEIVKVVKEVSIFDMVEPKFKVGDWITDGEGYIWQIDEVKTENYLLRDSENILFAEEIEKIDSEFHLWSIKDAKDGDVLVDHLNNILIYQEPSTTTHFHSHCYCHQPTSSFIADEGSHEIKDAYPTNKEQRDLLFQKMSEKGYEWDSKKNELKKVEQNFAELLCDTKIQYTSVEAGIKSFAETYSFNIESNLFHQLTKEQQELWKKEIEQACINGGNVGVELARDMRYKENKPVEEVNGDDYGIDSLWHVQRILEKTLGTVDGYETDDGILEHKAAITAVKKLREQKSTAWSNEDKKMIDRVIDSLEILQKPAPKRMAIIDKKISWLKSLKERIGG